MYYVTTPDLILNLIEQSINVLVLTVILYI